MIQIHGGPFLSRLLESFAPPSWHPTRDRTVQSNELAAPLVWAFAYFLLGLLSHALDGALYGGGRVWLPAGITVAALWLLPRARWFALLVLLIAAQVALGAMAHRELWRVLLLAFNETLVAAIAVGMLRGRSHAMSGPTFVRDLLSVALVASLTSGLLAAAWLQATQRVPLVPAWRMGALSELVGILVMVPALVFCTRSARAHPEGIARTEFAVGLLSLLGMLASVYVAFNGELDRKVLDVNFGTTYVPLLFLALVTVAWGARSGAWSVLLLCVIAMVYDARGRGPFVQLVQLHASNALLELQVYLGMAALMALLIGAFKTRRERIHEEVAAWNSQVALSLAASRQVAYTFDVRSSRFAWQGDVLAVLGLPAHCVQTLEQVLALVSPLDQARLRQRWLQEDDAPRRTQMLVRLQDGSTVLDRSRLLPRGRDGRRRVAGVWQMEPAD